MATFGLQQQKMRNTYINILLIAVAIWFALLDRCLIQVSGMHVSSAILTLVGLQLMIGILMWMAVNGRLPAVAEVLKDSQNFRMKFVVFGVPVIFLLTSPALLSESLYTVRYGSTDRFLLNSHVVHDLSCCWNVFSAAQG